MIIHPREGESIFPTQLPFLILSGSTKWTIGMIKCLAAKDRIGVFCANCYHGHQLLWRPATMQYGPAAMRSVVQTGCSDGRRQIDDDRKFKVNLIKRQACLWSEITLNGDGRAQYHPSTSVCGQWPRPRQTTSSMNCLVSHCLKTVCMLLS